MRRSNGGSVGSCRSHAATVENAMNHHRVASAATTQVSALSTMGYHHLDLIPLNPTPGSEWDASPKPVEREFVRRVLAQGVSCTVRDTRGQEIAAACGQLAAQED